MRKANLTWARNALHPGKAADGKHHDLRGLDAEAPAHEGVSQFMQQDAHQAAEQKNGVLVLECVLPSTETATKTTNKINVKWRRTGTPNTPEKPSTVPAVAVGGLNQGTGGLRGGHEWLVSVSLVRV